MAEERDRSIWNIKSAYTDQTAKVTKLLREGFEPFAVFPIKVDNPHSRDYKITRIKMYFKLAPVLPSVVPSVELQSVEPNQELVEEFKSWSVKHTQQLRELFETFLRPSSDMHTLTTGERVSLYTDKDMKTDTITTKSQAEQITNIEDEEEQLPVERTTETPQGDSYRVVNEVPEAAQGRVRTETQDRAIESIRAKHGTITVNPVGEDGVVTVLADNLIYTINPSGNFDSRENTANTSSLI